MRTAIRILSISVHLLYGLAADLQALGQFPLAHSLRPLLPDVLPLLLGQTAPMAEEALFGTRLRLDGSRALPDLITHHSLKADTIENWCSLVAVNVAKSPDRDPNFTLARCRPSITCARSSSQ